MRNHLLFITLILGLLLVTTAAATAPVANFTTDITSGPAPLTVSFTDSSLNNPTGWAWYFGDENFTEPWMQLSDAEWTAREAFTSVVMQNGSIFLMGGRESYSTLTNDTWRSTNNGTSWIIVNVSSGWTARRAHSSVVMPDSSIVLMGGYEGNMNDTNDTWRSMDGGATWTLVNASSGWVARNHHSSVAMPDGSIVLFGGEKSQNVYHTNDTWRSMDGGVTWTLVNASSGWSGRYSHSSVVMPDGSIVLMGGLATFGIKNDTSRSIDGGSTWTLVNASGGWSGRTGHSSVVMPDGSIILMGGHDVAYKNDVWRSTNNGATWTLVNPNAGWTARDAFSIVVMPDSSILLMGGLASGAFKNDTWRFIPAGSSAQNPSHIYTKPGIYQVALQVFNDNGYNSTRKIGYITVMNPAVLSDKIGVCRPSSHMFYLKNDTTPWTTTAINWGISTDLPITGDWNKDGRTEVGVYRPSTHTFYLKNGTVTTINWGISTDLPVTGDWNGDGRTDVGVYRPSAHTFYLKNGTTTAINWGISTDLPVTGDWNKDGRTEVGVYRPSTHTFYLKNGTVTTINWGASTDLPVTGDWNGDGRTDVGVYRPSAHTFYLKNGTTTTSVNWGMSTDLPVTGKW